MFQVLGLVIFYISLTDVNGLQNATNLHQTPGVSFSFPKMTGLALNPGHVLLKQIMVTWRNLFKVLPCYKSVKPKIMR